MAKKETPVIQEPKLKLSNPQRYVVPTVLNRKGLVQVNIPPRSSIDLEKTEITDSVANLISRKVLVLKQS